MTNAFASRIFFLPVTSAASAHTFLSAWQDYLLNTFVVFKVDKNTQRVTTNSPSNFTDVEEDSIEGLSSWYVTLRQFQSSKSMDMGNADPLLDMEDEQIAPFYVFDEKDRTSLFLSDHTHVLPKEDGSSEAALEDILLQRYRSFFKERNQVKVEGSAGRVWGIPDPDNVIRGAQLFLKFGRVWRASGLLGLWLELELVDGPDENAKWLDDFYDQLVLVWRSLESPLWNTSNIHPSDEQVQTWHATAHKYEISPQYSRIIERAFYYLFIFQYYKLSS